MESSDNMVVESGNGVIDLISDSGSGVSDSDSDSKCATEMDRESESDSDTEMVETGNGVSGSKSDSGSGVSDSDSDSKCATERGSASESDSDTDSVNGVSYEQDLHTKTQNQKFLHTGGLKPSDLEEAIRNNNKDYVIWYIQQHGPLNPSIPSDFSPLTVAIMDNHDDKIAKLLCRAGALPSLRSWKKNSHGRRINSNKISTPLGMAVLLCKKSIIYMILSCNRTNDHLEIDMKEGLDGSTPLLRTVRLHPFETRIALTLMKCNADPLVQDADGVTALGMAASWANLRLVKMMLVTIRKQKGLNEHDPIHVPKNFNGYSIYDQVIVLQHVFRCKKKLNRLKQILELLGNQTISYQTDEESSEEDDM